MHTWLPIHVEIPAEHPVVYANYACPNFVIIVNYMYQAYEQMYKVLQGHWERMPICQYRFHSIIHVNLRCFSLRQTFETVYICAIESTGHPEEACSLPQPKFLNEVKCFHNNDWNGQLLPDYS